MSRNKKVDQRSAPPREPKVFTPEEFLARANGLLKFERSIAEGAQASRVSSLVNLALDGLFEPEAIPSDTPEPGIIRFPRRGV